MVTSLTRLLRPELATVVAPVPCELASSDSLVEAIAHMEAGRLTCGLMDSNPRQQGLHQRDPGCLLVFEADCLVGIVTPWDLVRLIASGRDWREMIIADIMTSPVLSLKTSSFVDVSVPLALLAHHQIRHLPLINDHGDVVGILTNESLRPVLNSIDPLQQLMAADVMHQTIVQAGPATPLPELAHLMITHNMGDVVIVDPQDQFMETLSAIPTPIGLVSQQEIAQALSLELDPATIQARDLITAPLVTVQPDTSLQAITQIIQNRPAVLVIQEDGRMMGLVTQTDLLKLLHPARLNQLMQQTMQERTRVLEEQMARHQLITQLNHQIHASLNLQDVLDAAVTGVRSILQCDRTLIQQFQPNWSGVIVAESVGEGWTQALGNFVEDNCFRSQAVLYQEGRIIAVNNVDTAGYADCHLALLHQYQVNANLVVPILVSGQLWGLLIGHQCRSDRSWQQSDLTFMNEIGMQLAIALQQVATQQRWQAESQARQQAERELQQQRELLRTIIDTIPNKIFIKDWDGCYLLANRAIAEAHSTTVGNLIGKFDAEFETDPAIAAEFLQQNRAVISRQEAMFIREEKIRSTEGSDHWFQWQKCPIQLPGKNIPAVLGIGVDITYHKQTTAIFHQYERIVSATTDGIALLDRNYVHQLVNQVYLDWHEKTKEEIIGHSITELLGETAFQALIKPRLDRCLAGETQQYKVWFDYPNNRQCFFNIIYAPYIELDGAITGIVVTIHDLTSIKQAETQLELQNGILEQIARGQPLSEILDMLLRTMELQLVDGLCSILLCDQNGILHAEPAPQIPAAYLQTIDGTAIGEGTSSCGTAAFRREPVIVSEIATDPIWQNHREQALSYGLKAGWSIPIFASDGHVLGTFGVYYRECRTPQPQELADIIRAANLAGIAIEQQQARQTLEQLNQNLETRVAERTAALQQANLQLQNLGDRLSVAVKSAALGIWEWDLVNNVKIWDDRMYELYGIRIDQIEDFYQAWVNSLHPDDRPNTEIALQQALRGEKDYVAEFRVIHPDGSIRFLKAYGLVQRDGEGNPKRMIGINFDITERKQIELALQESEERYRQIVETQTEFIIHSRPDTTITFANTAICRAVGRSPDRILGLQWQEFVPAEALPELYQKIAALHLENPTFEHINPDYRANGQLGWTQWINLGKFNEQGELIEIQSVGRDITRLHQTEDALQQSEELFRNAFNSTLVGMALVSPTGRFLKVNYALCDCLGYSETELLNLTFQEVTHPADVETDQDLANQALAGERESYRIEKRFFNKQGQLVWGLLSVSLVRDEQGDPLYFVSQTQDISDRKQAEQQLHDLSERLNLALEAAEIGVWEWDVVTNRLLWDDRMLTLYGISREEFAGQYEDWAQRVHPDDLEGQYQIQQRALAGERVGGVEFRIIRPDGSVRFLFGHSLLRRNELGEPLRGVGLNIDMTDRKLAEQENQRLKDRLEFLLSSSPAVIFTCKPIGDYGMTYIGDNVSDVVGYTPNDFMDDSKFWSENVHPEDISGVFSTVPTLFQQGYYIHEYRFKHQAGYYLWVREEARLVRNEQGTPIEIIGYFADISDRKRAESALQNSEARFRRVFDSSVVGMLFANFQGQILDANDRFLQIVGYTRADLEAGLVRWDEMTPPEYVEGDQFTIQQLRQVGSIKPREKEYYHKDGSRISILIGIAILPDTPDQVVSVVLDISDRKRLEQEQQRLIAILEASTDYISMTDALSGYLIWNNAAIRQLCGIEQNADVVQPNLTDYYPQWAIDQLSQQAMPAALTNGSWIGESALLDAEGQEIPVSQLLLAHKSPQGKVEFFSTIMRDMRVHKEYEQRLEQTNAELMRATRLKDEFLANMSHELRTPLNAILGMAEGLQDQIFGEVNEKQLRAIQTIERTGLHLLSLINDILDLAKVESGQIELFCAPIAVAALCQSSLELIRQLAFKKEIQLDLKLPNHLPDLLVDERRIRQVLVNLLNNAVKFTPQGGHITLEASLLNHSPEHKTTYQWLRLAVQDTGIGIAPENLSKLFQPFVQIDSALNRQYEGTGLGLALVKRIIELHDGKVGLTSEVGVGSCFTIDLPIIPACSTLESHLQTSARSDLLQSHQTTAPLILLVEDREDNIMTMVSYLEAKGNRLLVARSGQEAIAQAEAEQPELILMDIQMSGMDGLEAIRQIRSLPGLSNTPIIALTALAMEGDQERCLAAGANAYLSKPVKLKQLAATIQKILQVNET